jgi:hypothetical protein
VRINSRNRNARQNIRRLLAQLSKKAMKKSIEFTTLSWETLLALSTTILAAGFIVTGTI